MSAAEEILKTVTNNQGVKGVVVMNRLGIPIRSNINNRLTVHLCALVQDFLSNAEKCARKLGIDENDGHVDFLRLRTKLHQEILIDPQGEFILITLQNPQFEPENNEKPKEKKEKPKTES